MATVSISRRACRSRPNPGGILISGPVYDQVHYKLSIGFERLGEQNLKNVAHPVTCDRVLQGGAPSRLQPPSER